MLFKFKPFNGPASYTWRDPDTGRMFNEASKNDLIDRIVAYRRQNNLEELEYLSETLENYWCGLPENTGKCVAADVERGILGYLKGGVALLKNLAYQKFAPQGIADTRSRQCSDCKYNAFPDKEGFLKWSDAIAEASTLGRRSKHHDELGSCAVCSCPLRAKVFYGEVIEIEPEWLPGFQEVHCWQLASGRVKKKP